MHDLHVHLGGVFEKSLGGGGWTRWVGLVKTKERVDDQFRGREWMTGGRSEQGRRTRERTAGVHTYIQASLVLRSHQNHTQY